MKGLKPHTHQERQKVIEEMIPLIKKKFGDNLIALAANASFARNEDTDYSDLELTAFVKEMPEGKKWDGIGKIRNGMLVELVWMTKETFVEETTNVNPDWYISASDVLVPIINKEFIEDLGKYKIKNLRKKCFYQAARRWTEVQESTGKVLNAIKTSNKENVSLLVNDMFLHMLTVLSFLNQTPFVTFSKFVSQAKKFELKPKGFDELIEIMVEGKYGDLDHLKETVIIVFSDLERICEDLELKIYHDNVDPNLPTGYEERTI